MYSQRPDTASVITFKNPNHGQTNVCQYFTTKPEFIFNISCESMDINTHVTAKWRNYNDELEARAFSAPSVSYNVNNEMILFFSFP